MGKPTGEELELLHHELCSALSDTTRIAILYELVDAPRHVGEIVEAMGLPQGTVSRHLKMLRERGIVRAQREGNRVLYELAETRVIEILSLMREILWDNLERRRAAAERIRPGRAGARSSGSRAAATEQRSVRPKRHKKEKP